ncbi:MAG: hypothetical protein C4293_21375, partial [Nitrospiraceae bacterium]
RPVASNTTEEGRKKNRRIEIELSSTEPKEPDSARSPQSIDPATIESQETNTEQPQPETSQEPQASVTQ